MGGKIDDIELTRYMEPILSGKAIRYTSKAPQLNYTDESIFYWDFEKEALRFFKLTSSGHIVRGLVTTEAGQIILEGASSRPDRTITFRNTFELNRDGKLIDKYYNPEGDGWRLGHTIEFDQKGN